MDYFYSVLDLAPPFPSPISARIRDNSVFIENVLTPPQDTADAWLRGFDNVSGILVSTAHVDLSYPLKK